MSRFWLVALLVFSQACSEGMEEDDSEVAHPLDYEEIQDYEGPGDVFTPVFDRHFVVTDTFYEDIDSVGADELQDFFEETPYGTRSWLADARFDGKRAADLIMDASVEFRINPLLLLLRMQVEQGLVSKTSRPTQTRVDRALGCGCPDNRPCMSQFKGFKNQMRCGAETHRKLFDLSKNGGAWSAGRTKRSLDPLSVTPRNHGTAALYAYTPWVLQGRGGNWLVWNVGRRFLSHLEATGAYSPIPVPWVGTQCVVDADCGFSSGQSEGFCFRFVDQANEERGFCTLPCAGGCPDRSGKATTFCVELEVGQGRCVSKSEDRNDYCSKIPGTRVETFERFVGDSGASLSSADVCAPDF